MANIKVGDKNIEISIVEGNDLVLNFLTTEKEIIDEELKNARESTSFVSDSMQKAHEIKVIELIAIQRRLGNILIRVKNALKSYEDD